MSEKDFSNDIPPESRAKNRLTDNYPSVSRIHKKVSETIKESITVIQGFINALKQTYSAETAVL